MTSHQTALILGAGSGIGGEVARRLVARGWTVRALNSDPDRLSADNKASGLTWLQGDDLSARDVAAAAEGVSIIVHAFDPPGYGSGGKLILLDNTIAAARAAKARIVLPGTVYNFGPDAFPELSETSPQRPATAKGRHHALMERRLRAAAEAGVSTLILRCGDFFGRRAENNWLVQPGLAVEAITYPGPQGIGHQWAYLPDAAETMVQLIEKSNLLENFAVFHMEGHWDADGTQMIAAIRAAVGDPNLKVRKLSWLALRLLSPLVPSFREWVESRHLWTTPVHMSNSRLLGVLGVEPRTPLDIAARETLAGMGCLPKATAT